MIVHGFIPRAWLDGIECSNYIVPSRTFVLSGALPLAVQLENAKCESEEGADLVDAGGGALDAVIRLADFRLRFDRGVGVHHQFAVAHLTQGLCLWIDGAKMAVAALHETIIICEIAESQPECSAVSLY